MTDVAFPGADASAGAEYRATTPQWLGVPGTIGSLLQSLQNVVYLRDLFSLGAHDLLAQLDRFSSSRLAFSQVLMATEWCGIIDRDQLLVADEGLRANGEERGEEHGDAHGVNADVESLVAEHV